MTIDSYLRHRREEEELATHDDVPWCYTMPDSIGNWHHERMFDSIMPLLQFCKQTTWMTVGDGRFASDAHFLRPHVASVTATSISGSTLVKAKERGWVDHVSEENAERISFADDSFDFVFCKESYHHLPRPAIGFYEMLRIARVGVVLIEPMEQGWSPLLGLKRMIKRLLRHDHAYDLFEPSGNFVYRININDLTKNLTSLNYSTLAWKGMNTFWYAGFDRAPKSGFSLARLGSRCGILAQDIACSLRLLSPGVASVMCFKAKPDDHWLDALRTARFHIIHCPTNPYLPNKV
jgi:SAM-dependent methyltransferase